MLDRIEQWIDNTNLVYQKRRISCAKFSDEFKGFFPDEFLQKSYYVTVNKIPKPDFPELRQMGLSNFIDMEVNGITYKNTYYILPHLESNLRLHFHELVHVAQWDYLKAVPFMERYMHEILTFGYSDSPLEKMAYTFDSHFINKGSQMDIPMYVENNI